VFLGMIDRLPTDGPEWTCDVITIAGDTFNDQGELLTEDVELWRRNPVDCVRELIGNPTFKDAMEYAPEMVFTDPDGKQRVYDEMWTGDWWWNIQVSMVTFLILQYTHIPLGKVESRCNSGTDNSRNGQNSALKLPRR
jgi:hypothetical protein